MRSFICDCCQLPTKAELAAEWTDGTKELAKTCQPCHEAKGKRGSLPEHPIMVDVTEYECSIEKAAKFAEQYGAEIQPGEYGVVMKNEWGDWGSVNAEEVRSQLEAYSRSCTRVFATTGLTVTNTVSLAPGGSGTHTLSSGGSSLDDLVQEQIRKHEEPLKNAQIGDILSFAGRKIIVMG